MNAYKYLFKMGIKTEVVTCHKCHHVFIIADGDYRLCMMHMKRHHIEIHKGEVQKYFKYIKGIHYE